MGAMRLLSRFRRNDDAPDPELLVIFEQASERLEAGSLEVARAHSRVTERFEQVEESTGSLRRRLAVGVLGGTGMWTTLVSTAAAHKAAAVALAVTAVAGGGVAVEASGLGPAVREAAGIGAPAGEGDGGVGVQGIGPSEDSSAVATVEEAEDVNGNLVTVLRDDGSFLVRGFLTEVDGNSITVEAAGGSPTKFTLADDATIRLRGPSDGNTPTASVAATVGLLVDGDLVLLQGQCGEGDDLENGNCVVTSVTLLGSDGGQPALLPSQADGAGQPEVLPAGNAPSDAGSQANDNKPGDLPAGPPSGSPGQPLN